MILLFVGKHVKEVDKRVCVQSVAATLNDCMVVVVVGGSPSAGGAGRGCHRSVQEDEDPKVGHTPDSGGSG